MAAGLAAPILLGYGDLFLLCSDGVTDMLVRVLFE